MSRHDRQKVRVGVPGRMASFAHCRTEEGAEQVRAAAGEVLPPASEHMFFREPALFRVLLYPDRYSSFHFLLHAFYYALRLQAHAAACPPFQPFLLSFDIFDIDASFLSFFFFHFLPFMLQEFSFDIFYEFFDIYRGYYRAASP